MEQWQIGLKPTVGGAQPWCCCWHPEERCAQRDGARRARRKWKIGVKKMTTTTMVPEVVLISEKHKHCQETKHLRGTTRHLRA
jgi:hypothetical protein